MRTRLSELPYSKLLSSFSPKPSCRTPKVLQNSGRARHVFWRLVLFLLPVSFHISCCLVFSGGRKRCQGIGSKSQNFTGNYRRLGWGGGQNVPNAKGGGGNRPKSCLWKAWTFDPQIEDLLWNLCRMVSKSGALTFSEIWPPHIPVSKTRWQPYGLFWEGVIAENVPQISAKFPQTFRRRIFGSLFAIPPAIHRGASWRVPESTPASALGNWECFLCSLFWAFFGGPFSHFVAPFACCRECWSKKSIQGKKKHININKYPGLSQDWAGAKNFVYVFFSGRSCGGEKHINKIPTKISGQSPENFVYVFCSLCVFFAPQVWVLAGPKVSNGSVAIDQIDFDRSWLPAVRHSQRPPSCRFYVCLPKTWDLPGLLQNRKRTQSQRAAGEVAGSSWKGRGRKMAGQMAGQPRTSQILAVHPFFSHFVGRKHPSRDVIFSGQILAKKCQKSSLYMMSSNL